jgi:hypothetical protein
LIKFCRVGDRGVFILRDSSLAIPRIPFGHKEPKCGSQLAQLMLRQQSTRCPSHLKCRFASRAPFLWTNGACRRQSKTANASSSRALAAASTCTPDSRSTNACGSLGRRYIWQIYRSSLSGRRTRTRWREVFTRSSPARTGKTCIFLSGRWLNIFLSEERMSGFMPSKNWALLPSEMGYAHLVQSLGLDAIVLVDGGTDILLRGDEAGLGTPSEDMASLAAVAAMDVPTRVVVCVGFGRYIPRRLPRELVGESGSFDRRWGISRCHRLAGAHARGSLVPRCRERGRHAMTLICGRMNLLFSIRPAKSRFRATSSTTTAHQRGKLSQVASLDA